ncbi:hypothetical protein D3C86_1389840 [compost metagenome]
MGKHQQRFLFHVQHSAIVEPGVGRQRYVDEDRHGKIMRLRAACHMNAVAALSAGGDVASGAHHRVKIEIVAVKLGSQHLVTWPQHLELPPDPADKALGVRVGFRRRLSTLRRGGDDPAMVGEVGATAIIPFGIGQFRRQRRMIQRFGRQVEIEAEAG